MYVLLIAVVCIALLYGTGNGVSLTRAGVQGNPVLAVLIVLLFLIALLAAIVVLAGLMGSVGHGYVSP